MEQRKTNCILFGLTIASKQPAKRKNQAKKRKERGTRKPQIQDVNFPLQISIQHGVNSIVLQWCKMSFVYRARFHVTPSLSKQRVGAPWRSSSCRTWWAACCPPGSRMRRENRVDGGRVSLKRRATHKFGVSVDANKKISFTQ